MSLLYRPSISPDATRDNLSRLIAFGSIRNQGLDRVIAKLEERFHSYCSCYSLGLWAPGLLVTSEMRAVTERYLPMAEISAALRRFFSLALRYERATETALLDTCVTWPDFLQRVRLDEVSANPALLLKRLIADDAFRIRFLFAFFLPRHHGGNFLRYPDQISFLECRIAGRRDIHLRGIRCLDAACGTGEGVYDLALLLLKMGISSPARQIDGLSIDPFELFAAAHGYFPHDPTRERQYRGMTEPLFSAGETDGITFSRGDITRPASVAEEPYDIILCNGILGGPFIHGEKEITAAVAALAGRLAPGGVVLVSDRFHGGWKKAAPPSLLGDILKRSGLDLLPVTDGFAAEKKRP